MTNDVSGKFVEEVEMTHVKEIDIDGRPLNAFDEDGIAILEERELLRNGSWTFGGIGKGHDGYVLLENRNPEFGPGQLQGPGVMHEFPGTGLFDLIFEGLAPGNEVMFEHSDRKGCILRRRIGTRELSAEENARLQGLRGDVPEPSQNPDSWFVAYAQTPEFKSLKSDDWGQQMPDVILRWLEAVCDSDGLVKLPNRTAKKHYRPLGVCSEFSRGFNSLVYINRSSVGASEESVVSDFFRLMENGKLSIAREGRMLYWKVETCGADGP